MLTDEGLVLIAWARSHQRSRWRVPREEYNFLYLMASWQKRARLGVAVFGIVCAVAVYAAMRERTRPAAVAAPTRLDPKTLIESSGNILQQVRGTKQDYVIKAAQQLMYPNGATKLMSVEISVRNRGGRDYVITAKEAQAGARRQELQLMGDVKLVASDGFWIATSEAFFNDGDGQVRAPGEFTFGRNHMSGSGVGMTYDKNADVLAIAGQAHVRMTNDAGMLQTELVGSAATFSRPDHLLLLNEQVHVVHLAQITDAGHAVAHLNDNDDRLTRIELAGSAGIVGSGQGLESMHAGRIDLAYGEDGQTITRVVLTDNGAVVMSAQGGGTGRQIFGELLDLTLASDGSLTSLVGRTNVRFELAAGAESPARSIRARDVDARGEGGKGLTGAHFVDRVEFREEARSGSPPRMVRSGVLDVTLRNDAVDAARFGGAVRFEERDLQASAANVVYQPSEGLLRLSGRDGGGGPRVTDSEVTVEANTIDLTLSGRMMVGSGTVRTTLRPRSTGSGGAADDSSGSGRLPGLLEQGRPANVSAGTVSYEGSAGQALFTGGATLWQGDTAIRGNRIGIDQSNGDLQASGSASSTLMLDTGLSIGHADSITYVDADRKIAYGSTGAVLAQLSGPQGDLRARRVEVVLAREGNRADRLEAYDSVSLRVDTRVAAGARLTYFAEDERYVMTGGATTPVRVVENCRETTGKTLTFFKSADRIIVDGNEERRTQTTSNGGRCSESRPR